MPVLRAWLCDSLTRVYPRTPEAAARRLVLEAARGERLSFQVCLHHEGDGVAKASVTVAPPAGVTARVRRVGYVPVPHINTGTPAEEREGAGMLPGLCPDPLFEGNEALLGPAETMSFWVTLDVAPDSRVGQRAVSVTVRGENLGETQLTVVLNVHRLVLQPRRRFPVTHWFYADAILDWYKWQPWDQRFWEILPAYLRNLTEHGQDVLYTPLFTPPLDGVKRPSQLLAVTRRPGGKYTFDWRHVRQWLRTADKAGLRQFEWSHLFTQWGVKHALRIYEGPNGDGPLLWDPATPATGPVYAGFLAQFLPAFKRFLDAEGLLKRSYFHVSDEPHGDEHLENYRRARALLKELAPWMRVMDALSDIRFGREKLTDMPIPSISTALNFRAENIPCWCYYCCGPRGRFLNRLMDTPLAKIRMSGWLFARFEMRGFLHWGYNYWQRQGRIEMIDPFTESSGMAWPGWAYGDTFEVYPGPTGPLDSIRWEVWAESLQDMALLQTAGIAPDSRLLRPLRSFESFPKTKQWVYSARRSILRK